MINNIKSTHLITSFPKSDWYVTGSVPVPNRASLAVGGVKSTIKPSEAASIWSPAKLTALIMTVY